LWREVDLWVIAHSGVILFGGLGFFWDWEVRGPAGLGGGSFFVLSFDFILGGWGWWGV